MYFATNLPKPTLPFEISREFKDLCATQQGNSMHLFALIDGAFDEDFFRTRYRRTPPPQSLYDNTALQQFGAAAPHLMMCPSDEGECAAWLNYLFAKCGNKPMLSIIASPLAADELATHMRPYLVAMTPDTVKWPVRWGDTRVLPTLLEALEHRQRDHFLLPVARWWSPARDGSLLRWDGAAEQPASAGFGTLPLSDEAFATLVTVAEPDSVLSNIHDSQPYLLSISSPAELHARVAKNLDIATLNGIHASPERQHFSALTLLLCEDFTTRSAMVELLRKTRLGGTYFDEIAALPASFFQATKR